MMKKLISIIISLHIITLFTPTISFAQAQCNVVDRDLCLAPCIWREGVCRDPNPPPSTCTTIEDSSDCRYPCIWVGRCTKACNAITDPTECGYSPGCNYNAASNSCTGIPQPPSLNNSGAFSSSYNELLNVVGLKITLTSISGLSSALLRWIFPFAGLILFIMLLFGGFLFLSAGAAPDQIDKAKKLITLALAGFMIIFFAFWIVQILEVVFGLNILG